MIRTAVLAVAFAFTSMATVAQAKPAPAKALAPADQAQIDASERVLYGPYDCDFKQTIEVSKNATPGYVTVKFKTKVFTMKPSFSSTGALRMEDVAGVGLLLQIANKSMLMDTKAGKRLVDACVHEKQRTAAN